MAKPPVSCFVYKRLHKYRYMPRPVRGNRYDPDAYMAVPEHFEDRLEDPPKLWVAWLYKNTPYEFKRTRKIVELLFGEEYQINEMKVFKNTPHWNNLLWRIKHLIEIHPITFPNGVPTEEDINGVRLLPTGECLMDRKYAVDERVLKMSDMKNWSQLDESIMNKRAMRRYTLCMDVQEDAPWTLSHRSDF